MALSQQAETIEQHLEIVGNKFELAQIIMHRTRQLMKGDAIKGINIAKVGSEFNPHKRGEIPPHRFPKIALEELRQGKFAWKRIEKEKIEINEIDGNQIVFGE